jgi:hypothetical protein
MKWTIKWDSVADSNDADYIRKHGTLGVYDDENPAQMKKLLILIRAVDSMADCLDYGSWDFDYDKLVDDIADGTVVTEEDAVEWIKKNICDDPSDEDTFHDCAWEFMYNYMPRDPEDDSRAHDLRVSFTKIPGEVSESSVDTSWIMARAR